jgi:hypothetical protein
MGSGIHFLHLFIKQKTTFYCNIVCKVETQSRILILYLVLFLYNLHCLFLVAKRSARSAIEVADIFFGLLILISSRFNE